MIQFRPTLDSSSTWAQLTNAVPANATPRATYVIPCCTLDTVGWTGGGSGGTGELPPAPGAMSMDSLSLESEPFNPLLGLWAMPADGSADPVPFAIYPPGVDTNNLFIFEPPQELLAEMALSGGEMSLSSSEGGTPLGISSGGCDCPGMGFFRIYHVPTFPSGVATYTFDGPTFVPVDFADYLTLDMATWKFFWTDSQAHSPNIPAPNQEPTQFGA